VYPRNAASPPRLSIGPVVQISDGAVQTAGVSVKVIPQGGTESAGAGTVAYSADGAVLYTPTQGETDYVAVVFVASKTGCIPASVTVVTTASATAGYAGLDWGKVTSATSTVNLSGTTISTTQAVASVSGSVGSISGVTFPTNFSSLAINSSGHVSRVTLVDTTTTNTDMRGTDGAALASAWTATRAGYLDSVLLAANSNRTVQVTGSGSGHIAADVHAMQPDVITASALAADAVAEIQSGLATSAAVAAVQSDVTTLLGRITATLFSGITYLSRWLGALAGKTADSATQTEIRATAAGATYTITTDSLEAIRDNSGGGGGSGDASQTTLLEVQGTVDSIAASLSGTTVSVSSRVSAAGEITLWAGDDCRVRSGTEIEVTITDVGGAIYTRLNGIGIANLAWGAARIVQPAGAITGTIAALTQAGSGASQTLTISIEITDGGSDLRAADDYTWQIVSSEQHGTEYDQQVELEGSLVLRRRVAVPVY
jgi:hypothetical protein